MKKQFELLEEFAQITRESSTRIKSLQSQIEKELQEMKYKLLDSFNNYEDILYLISLLPIINNM